MVCWFSSLNGVNGDLKEAGLDFVMLILLALFRGAELMCDSNGGS